MTTIHPAALHHLAMFIIKTTSIKPSLMKYEIEKVLHKFHVMLMCFNIKSHLNQNRANATVFIIVCRYHTVIPCQCLSTLFNCLMCRYKDYSQLIEMIDT